MNCTSLTKKLVAGSSALVLACSATLPAAIFKFVPFEYSAATNPDLPNDPDLAPIEITLEVVDNGGTLYMMILNTSDQSDPQVDGSKPTVTSIFIEDPTNILGDASLNLFDALGSIGTLEGEGVAYNDAESGGSLPGGNNIGFTSTIHFDSTPPPAKNGIDPGEKGSFQIGATDLSAVEAALTDNTIRVGIHVQQIGNGNSAGFVHMPEPGSALLGVIGGALLLLRRRR